jgi:hypothetical protein
MDAGEFLTRWSVRLALVLYLVAILAFLARSPRNSDRREARLVWTAGCSVMWLHFAAAFQFYHHWSHLVAYQATARDTEVVLGRPFGGGVYFNYLFAALWTADVLRLWLPRRWSGSSRWPSLAWVTHAFLAFIVFNATVVFGEGIVRWAGLAAFVALAMVLLSQRARRQDSQGQALSRETALATQAP